MAMLLLLPSCLSSSRIGYGVIFEIIIIIIIIIVIVIIIITWQST